MYTCALISDCVWVCVCVPFQHRAKPYWMLSVSIF